MSKLNRREFVLGMLGEAAKLWLPEQRYPVTDEAGPWFGWCTYYSRAGCVGCNPSLRMADGSILDDNAYTLAFMKAPLGTYVWVINFSVETWPAVLAKVTDRGGFEQYGILADLNLRVHREVENRSRESTIKIVRAIPEEIDNMKQTGSHLPSQLTKKRIIEAYPEYENLVVR